MGTDRQALDLMIDFETLATTEDAALLSVAAVTFDRVQGVAGSSIYYNFDVRDQIMLGRAISKETVDWWRKTDSLLFYDHLYPENYTNGERTFTRDLKSIFDEYKIGKVWSRGCMDFHILQRFIELPHWMHADVRTLDLFIGKMPQNDNKHNALADCMVQIEHVIKAGGLFNAMPSV